MRALAAQRLLPGEGGDIEFFEVEPLGEGGRSRVANGEALAIGRNETAVRHAHARGRAVPGEDHVAVEIDLRQIRQCAVARLEPANVGELELLDDVGHPAGTKTFPGDHIDAALAEQRPQRHLHRAGIGRRHDADAVAGRDLEDIACQLDRLLGRFAQGPEEKLGFAGRSPGLVGVVMVVYPSR